MTNFWQGLQCGLERQKKLTVVLHCFCSDFWFPYHIKSNEFYGFLVLPFRYFPKNFWACFRCLDVLIPLETAGGITISDANVTLQKFQNLSPPAAYVTRMFKLIRVKTVQKLRFYFEVHISNPRRWDWLRRQRVLLHSLLNKMNVVEKGEKRPAVFFFFLFGRDGEWTQIHDGTIVWRSNLPHNSEILVEKPSRWKS